MSRALHITSNIVRQVLDADVLLAPTIDATTTAPTLTIGDANATTVNVGTNAAATTINIGTGAVSAQTITIGSADQTNIVLDGNVEITGTEEVIGDTTFRGNIQLGDEASDTIDVQGLMSFSTGRLDSDVYFTGNAGSTRTLGIEGSAAGAGTRLQLLAGAAAAGSDAAGGGISLLLGAPDGVGANPKLYFGQLANVSEADAYEIRTLATNSPGLRYNNDGGTLAWQLTNNGSDWYNILTSATVTPVQAGTNVNDVLQWNGTEWEDRPNITLPETNLVRTIAVAGRTSGTTGGGLIVSGGAAFGGTNADGGALALQSGAADGTGTSGSASLSSAENLTGDTGIVGLLSGDVSTGASGDIRIHSGSASGIGASGDILVAAGTVAAGGTNGATRLYRNIGFVDDTAAEYARVNLASSGSLAYTGSDVFTDGARFYDADGIGMVWAASEAEWFIVAEDADSGVGTAMTLKGGQGATDGGGANVRGGDGLAGAGGSILVKGGSGTAGGGDVEVRGGDTSTSGVGGNVTVAAGASLGDNNGAAIAIIAGAGTGTDANGGSIRLTPGAPTGAGNEGLVLLGSGTHETPTLAFVSSDYVAPTLTGPGFRYNINETRMEFCDDNTDNWQPFAAGGGAVVVAGTVHNQILQWDEDTDNQWEPSNDLTLPQGQGDRTISVQQHASSNGENLMVRAGDGSTAGDFNGGNLTLSGGVQNGAGNSGNATLMTPATSTGTSGDVTISAGSSGHTTGNVVVLAGDGLALNGGVVGGAVTITAGAGAGAAHDGGAITMTSGASAGTGVSGVVTIGSGVSVDADGSTGEVYLRSGDAHDVSGNVYVYSGETSQASGVSGDADIWTGDAPNGTSGASGVHTGDGRSTGGIEIDTGDATVSGSGNVNIRSGTGTTTSGYVFLRTGTAAASGYLSLQTGNASSGNSGAITIQSGTAVGAATVGAINITGGTNTSTGTGGNVAVTGGGTTTGTGGSLTLAAGTASGAGTGGSTYVRAGGGGTAAGVVYLGDSNTSEVQFGGTSSTTIDFLGNAGNRVVSDIVFQGNAGGFQIYAAATTSGLGTPLQITGGDGPDGNGSIIITGGSATTAGGGGDVTLQAGSPLGENPGASIFLAASAGSGTNNDGGSLWLEPGAPSGSGDSGALVLGNSAVADAYLLFYGSNDLTPSLSSGPGFRHSDSNGRVEFNNGDGVWRPFAEGGGGSGGTDIDLDGDGTVLATELAYVLNSSGAKAARARANAAGTAKAIGVYLGSNKVRTAGATTVKFVEASGGNPGDEVWLDETTAGTATLTAPSASGEFQTFIGYLKTAVSSNAATVVLQVARPIGV